MDQKFQVSNDHPQISLRVDGDLRLIGEDVLQVRVESSASDGMRISQSGGAMEITCRGDCWVTAPKNSDLRIEKVGGDGTVIGLHGPLTIEKIGGDVNLQDIRSVTVGGIGGELAAVELQGDLFVQKVGGDVAARNIQGEVQIGSVGGMLAMESVGGSVNAKVGGDISISLSSLVVKSYELRAGGELACRVPANSSIDVSLDCGSERMILRLPGMPEVVNARQYQARIGDGATKISLKAGGDIYLTSLPPETDEAAVAPTGMEADLEHLGEKIEQQVSAKFRLADFTSRLKTGLTEQTRSLSQRAVQRADRRIQNALQKINQKIFLPPAWPAPPVSPEAPVLGGTTAPIEETASSPSSSTRVTDDERLRILQMVENKKITVDEAEQLLETLEELGGEEEG